MVATGETERERESQWCSQCAAARVFCGVNVAAESNGTYLEQRDVSGSVCKCPGCYLCVRPVFSPQCCCGTVLRASVMTSPPTCGRYASMTVYDPIKDRRIWHSAVIEGDRDPSDPKNGFMGTWVGVRGWFGVLSLPRVRDRYYACFCPRERSNESSAPGRARSMVQHESNAHAMILSLIRVSPRVPAYCTVLHRTVLVVACVAS